MIINNTELSGIIDFKSEFLGYIWLSDQTKPIVIKNQKIDFDLSKINPFIIEGHIIDKKNMLSYSIFQRGNGIEVSKFSLNEIPKEWHTSVIDDKIEYLPNFPGIKSLVFQKYWTTENDVLCAGMKVYKPVALIFTNMI